MSWFRLDTTGCKVMVILVMVEWCGFLLGVGPGWGLKETLKVYLAI